MPWVDSPRRELGVEGSSYSSILEIASARYTEYPLGIPRHACRRRARARVRSTGSSKRQQPRDIAYYLDVFRSTPPCTVSSRSLHRREKLDTSQMLSEGREKSAARIVLQQWSGADLIQPCWCPRPGPPRLSRSAGQHGAHEAFGHASPRTRCGGEGAVVGPCPAPNVSFSNHRIERRAPAAAMQPTLPAHGVAP